MESAGVLAAVAAGLAILRQRHSARGGLPASDSPVSAAWSQDRAERVAELGHACRGEFLLDFSGATHCNHGSYGTCPRAVHDAVAAEQCAVEAWPDAHFRRTALPRFKAVADSLGSELLGAPRGTCAFVKNATEAVNAVLRSLRLKGGDEVVFFRDTYNACKNAIMDTVEHAGASAVVVDVPFPIASSGAIVEALRATLTAHPRAVFVLLDAITSPTGVRMPVPELVRVCHGAGAAVMVDAAHAPAQLFPLDVPSWGAEWVTGNLHKWCFTGKGCALLYAAPEVQPRTQGALISHFWRREDWRDRFFMQGTMDLAPFLSAPAAVAFVRERLGGWARVNAYCTGLTSAAAALLVDGWGTQLLVAESSLAAPFLASIEVPIDWRSIVRRPAPSGVPTGASAGGGVSAAAALLDARGLSDAQAEAALAGDEGFNERIAGAVLAVSGVQSMFYTWRHGGRMRLWCRISGAVYNELSDYARLRDAVLRLQREGLPAGF